MRNINKLADWPRRLNSDASLQSYQPSRPQRPNECPIKSAHPPWQQLSLKPFCASEPGAFSLVFSDTTKRRVGFLTESHCVTVRSSAQMYLFAAFEMWLSLKWKFVNVCKLHRFLNVSGWGCVGGCQIAPWQKGETLLVCKQGVTTIKWEATVI